MSCFSFSGFLSWLFSGLPFVDFVFLVDFVFGLLLDFGCLLLVLDPGCARLLLVFSGNLGF